MIRAGGARNVAALFRRASIARSASSLRKQPPIAPRYQKPVPIDPSQAVPESSPSANSQPRIERSQWLPWLIASTFAFGTAMYAAQLYVAASKPCHNPHIAELSQQKDVAARYDYTADSFDGEVGLSELLMGINGMRKKLAKKCSGHVLEVSCGTGRNLGYYDIQKAVKGKSEGKVKSLTFIDLSPQMVDVCKKKWDALYGASRRLNLKPDLQVRFMTGSALGTMPAAPNGSKYDTIIQTMGLCSTPSPVQLLENIVKHLDTSKPESRVLLLEHGRSYMPWMNNVLDNAAEKHAELHGCWFNRDIGSIVQEAAQQTELELVNERRHHLGTTWIFELKPTEQTLKRAASTSLANNEQETTKDVTPTWLSRLGWR